jgi:MFS family permease
MSQDMFGISPAVAGGYVGLLSIFNMGGRFLWSSLSDLTGRKAIYAVFFVLGGLLYCLIPVSQKAGSVVLFVSLTCVIISMYGGGFATIPAYLRDLFGTSQVGAIHGRVITAWSVAAILGPQLITNLSAYAKSHGVAPAKAYNSTMLIMAGILVLGLICDAAVRPVDRRHHEGADQAGLASP